MFQALCLSPHFDDAVLSCGAQIWDRTQRGERVLIATVCAAAPPPPEGLSPYAFSLHERWQAQGNFDRAAEDRRAVTHLNATPWHMRYSDCIYRRAPSGTSLYNSDEDIFGSIAPQEMPLIDEVARVFKQFEIELSPNALVMVPRAIGNHVDHQLTRAAAEKWLISHPRLRFQHYADYPYADYPYAESIPGGEELPISPVGIRHTIQSLRAYASQISSFWPDDSTMVEKVTLWPERAFYPEL
jgi:LmbE family N-acetylglucosaminyl deacetylase